MPVRKTRKTCCKRRVRGGRKYSKNYPMVPYKARRKQWTGLKSWLTKTAIPWLRSHVPKAHKYVKDNKLISKGLKSFNESYTDLPMNMNNILPYLASGAEMYGYGKGRGRKTIRRRKGRGLNHTGGSLNRTGGMRKRTYRRRRK